jgi:hypothetical protein
LYSVAELVLGFKTAGILHQPFPPADNTQTVEAVVANTLPQQTTRIKRIYQTKNQDSVLFLAVVFGITVEL